MSDLQKTTTINLSHPVRISNVKGDWQFPAGTNVEVPVSMADEVMRIAFEHQEYLNNLHKKRTFEQDAGTIAVGSGAE